MSPQPTSVWVAMVIIVAGTVVDLVDGQQFIKTAPHERLHHMCSVPPDPKDYHLAENWCTACYMETLAGLASMPGSDMVIGANDGKSFDPAWEFGYWKSVPHHTIVWVEPNPSLFLKLAANTAHVTNKVLLNKAARPLSMEGDTLTLHCWNTTMITEVLEGRMESPLPPEIGPIRSHWNALCALDVANVWQASDVKSSLSRAGIPKDKWEQIMSDVGDKFILKHTVPARTPAELVQDAGVSDLRYLQIDVEGLDNEIIKSLPLGENGFEPSLILYENHFGYDVKGFLEDHGYFVCCCLKQWGSNIVAVKVPKHVSNFTKSPYRPDRRFRGVVPDRAAIEAMEKRMSGE